MPTFRPTKKGVRMSEAIAEAYASAPSAVVIHHTLAFYHENFVDDLGAPTAAYVVCDVDDLTATLEADAELDAGSPVLFKGIPFELTLPGEEDAGSSGELQIKIENVSRFLVPYIDLASMSITPIRVVYRPYLNSDLTAPHISPPLQMTLKSIDVDVFAVTARAGFGDLSNRRFPYVNYVSRNFPGLSAR